MTTEKIINAASAKQMIRTIVVLALLFRLVWPDMGNPPKIRIRKQYTIKR